MCGLHESHNVLVCLHNLLLGGHAILVLLRGKLIILIHTLPIQFYQQHLTDLTAAGPNASVRGLVVLNKVTNLVGVASTVGDKVLQDALGNPRQFRETGMDLLVEGPDPFSE